jgi:hypothetical protein
VIDASSTETGADKWLVFVDISEFSKSILEML